MARPWGVPYEQRLVTGFRPGAPHHCWTWTGGVDKLNGYGWIMKKLETGDWKKIGAHRAVYEYLVGPVPPQLELHHTCGHRNCVNPSHLRPVTHAENIRLSVRPPRYKRRAQFPHHYQYPA